MAQKKNLKQKLAVAMSVVNALNVGAAVALPYANMTQCLVADGAKVEKMMDGVAGAMYGTAHAAHKERTLPDGAGSTESGTTLDDAVINLNPGGQTSGVTIKGTETTSAVINVGDGGFSHDTTTS